MEEYRARVIAQEKGLYRIACEGREYAAEVSGRFRHEAAAPSDFPAVGDYVTAACPDDGSSAIIGGLFPHRSAFVRRAAGTAGQEQVVAANVDTVFLCMSLNQDFNVRRLERYLALAWESGAEPVVVLTKSDLCEDTARKRAELAGIAAGAAIVTASSLNEDFAALAPWLTPGKTAAFLGSSGVGKSTLINRLLGEERLATAAIREDDDRGRHTTTRRALLTLPNGAFVIDTPGMRELGVWNSDAGIERAFSEIEALSRRCRFADCTHTNEPGCAILAALADGSLPCERWNAFRKLEQENAYTANESAYRQAKKEKFRAIAKINRARKN